MLHNLQSEFSASIFDEENIVAEKHVKAGGLTSARRLAIYRHNVFANLVGALREIYPVILRIIGSARFEMLATQFVQQTKSTSGDLNDFGLSLPRFLQGQSIADELPYLADVATLEWAWHCAFHAADANGFDVMRLAALTPEQYDALQFMLHPSVNLVSSAYPLQRIWQVNQPEYAGDMELDWSVLGDLLLIVRREFAVEIRLSSAGEFAFLRALHEKKILSDAVTAASLADNSFNLQTVLASLIQTGVIIDFKE